MPLSPAEVRALAAISEHVTVAATASALFVAPQTLKNTLGRIYKKLGAKDRFEALLLAQEAGYLVPDRDG